MDGSINLGRVGALRLSRITRTASVHDSDEGIRLAVDITSLPMIRHSQRSNPSGMLVKAIYRFFWK